MGTREPFGAKAAVVQVVRPLRSRGVRLTRLPAGKAMTDLDGEAVEYGHVDGVGVLLWGMGQWRGGNRKGRCKEEKARRRGG